MEQQDATRKRALQAMLVAMLVASIAMSILAFVLPIQQMAWPLFVRISFILVAGAFAFGLAAIYYGFETPARRLAMIGATYGTLIPTLDPASFYAPPSHLLLVTNVLVVAFLSSWRTGILIGLADLVFIVILHFTMPEYTVIAVARDAITMTGIGGIAIAMAWWTQDDRGKLEAGHEALKARVADMDAIIESSPDAIIALDEHDQIMAANSVAKEWAHVMMRMQVERGLSIINLTPQQFQPRIETFLERVRLRAWASASFAWPVEGESRYSVHGRRIDADDGSIVLTVRDVTEDHKTAADERDQFRVRIELEHLKKTEEFRRRLMNTASHELRTPLTPVRLHLHMLKRAIDKQDKSAMQKSLNVVERNIGRFKVLLDDLVDVNILEGGHMPLRMETLSVNELIQGEVDAYQEVAQERGVTLTVQGPPLNAVGDMGRLAQVMSNLINNSVKYSPMGGNVLIRASSDLESVMVEITDQGVGFSPEAGAHLFEPFSRIQEQDEQEEGTGLGLYICRGIVERHGGKLWATSPGPGGGATFGFSIPISASVKYDAPPVEAHE